MSFDAIQRIWNFSIAAGSARLVLLSIATHEGKSGVSWPSLDRLAEKTKISRRQVIRVISDLETSGELAIIHGRGRHNSNFYTVLAGLSEEDKSSAREALLKFAKGDMLSPFDNIKGDVETPIEGVKDDIQTAKDATAVSRESLILKNISRENVNRTWSLLIDNIRPQVDRVFFETWIKPLTPIGWRGDGFMVRTSGEYHRDFISARIGAMINSRFPAIVNLPEARVEFLAQ